MKKIIELHRDDNNSTPIMVGTAWIAIIETVDSKTTKLNIGIDHNRVDQDGRLYEIYVKESYDEIKRILLEE